MPKDNRRLDLNADLDKLSHDFLKDVEAATKEVEDRTRADAEKDRRRATKAKDRRTSTIIIAAATVVLILVAYWAVSARTPEPVAPVAVTVPQRVNPPMMSRSATVAQRSTAPRMRPPAATANYQQPQAPPNEYEPEPM